MPRWASVSSLNSSSSSRSGRDAAGSALEPSLLTTCVGSMSELIDLISKVAQGGRAPVPLTIKALNALFYYMRCSQVRPFHHCLLKLPVTILSLCHNLTRQCLCSWNTENEVPGYKSSRTSERTSFFLRWSNGYALRPLMQNTDTVSL